MFRKPKSICVRFLEAGEKRAAAAKRVYEQLLDEKPPLMAYDVLLATLRSELSGRSLVAEEEVEVRLVSSQFCLSV